MILHFPHDLAYVLKQSDRSFRQFNSICMNTLLHHILTRASEALCPKRTQPKCLQPIFEKSADHGDLCVSTPGPRVHHHHLFHLHHLFHHDREFHRQGRVALSPYHTQRSCGREWETGPDQPCVPAVLSSFDSTLPLVCCHGDS